MAQLKPYTYSYFSRAFRKHSTLIAVCLVVLLSSGGLGLTHPILSLYVRGYGANTVLVGVFIATFAVGRILVTIPAGRWIDRHSSRTLMIIGAVVIGTGGLCMALVENYLLLLVARFIEGVGSGLFMASATILIAQISGIENRGRITSLFQSSIFLGLTITPLLGGILTSALGIKAPIFGYAFLHVVAALLVFGLIPAQEQRPPDRRADREVSPRDGQESKQTIYSSLIERDFVLITLVAFLVFVGRSGARDTLLPLYGESIVGLDSVALGTIFSLLSLMNFLAIPIAGTMSDRLGRKSPIILGLILNIVALSILGVGTGYEMFVVSALAMGLAKGFSESASMIYVTDISRAGSYGASLGLFLTLRDLGLLAGPVILSAIADIGGLHIPYLFTAMIFTIMTVAFMFLARETRSVESPPIRRM